MIGLQRLVVRDMIRVVAKKWRAQYPQAADDKARIQKELDALDLETCSAEMVDAIIGNKSWTEVGTCILCAMQTGRIRDIAPELFQSGEEPDYESRTVELCFPCIEAVYLEAKALKEGGPQ